MTGQMGDQGDQGDQGDIPRQRKDEFTWAAIDVPLILLVTFILYGFRWLPTTTSIAQNLIVRW